MDNNKRRGPLDTFRDYLDTERGRVLLNYLYSWGAAIVILGALFKMTHIDGANLMLFIGMGTEVVVFIISGFERPYVPQSEDEANSEEFIPGASGTARTTGVPVQVATETLQHTEVQPQNAAAQSGLAGGMTGASSPAPGVLCVEGVESVTEEYLERLRSVAEKMQSVYDHSEKIERNSEEIELLGRNLVSLNRFYEMQLRSVSSQMESVDKVQDQTLRMLAQIEELNSVYARMIEAMKVNSQMRG